MRISILLSAMLLLGACGSSVRDALDTRQNAGPCPPAGSLYTASRIVDLTGEDVTYSQIKYTGEITDVRLFCRYVGEDPVEAELELDFAFGKGPAATSDTNDYVYWIAVTRRNGKVLNKERFSVQADFNGGTVTGATEIIQDIIIPRADESVSAANFEIVVGFELTEEQATFNREGRRFRLNAGN